MPQKIPTPQELQDVQKRQRDRQAAIIDTIESMLPKGSPQTPAQAVNALVAAHTKRDALKTQLAGAESLTATVDAAYKTSLGLDAEGQPVVNDRSAWLTPLGLMEVVMTNGAIVSVLPLPTGTRLPIPAPLPAKS